RRDAQKAGDVDAISLPQKRQLIYTITHETYRRIGKPNVASPFPNPCRCDLWHRTGVLQFHAELERFQVEADNHAAVDPIDPACCRGADLAWEDMPYSLHDADWLRRRLYGELQLERIYATNIDRSRDHVQRRLYDGGVAGAQPQFAVRDAGARDTA